jgi:hypothetical protein
MSENRTEQLKQSLSGTDVSGFSPAVLQHQGIQVLANSQEDSMGDLTSQQITAFAILRAYNEMVPIPRTMAFIDNYISLSRARDREARKEYAGCYKSVYVIGGGNAQMINPGLEESNKQGILNKLLNRGRKSGGVQQ